MDQRNMVRRWETDSSGSQRASTGDQQALAEQLLRKMFQTS